MVALVRAMQDGSVPANAAIVISNAPGAPGLATAKRAGIPTAVVDHTKVKPREAHERAVVALLKEHRVDIVCLAGYMRRLSPFMVQSFPGRILNVHPALLPAFPGLDVQQAALDYGVKIAGCTVHLVDDEVDHGPIVLQAAVPVQDDDTVETLSARILEREHAIYPEALGLLASGRVKLEGRKVRLTR